ncbi:MAG: ester cyclase [Haloferacaceae archaeon]
MDKKELVEQLADAWTNEDMDALEELYHSEHVDHWSDTTFEGIGKIKEAEAKYRRAFPDYSMEPRLVVEGDDHVAHYWEIEGTHDGEFNGIPPTGKEIRYQGMAIHRVEDDRIVESWWMTDRLQLLRDLDVVPGRERLAEQYLEE